MQFIAGGTSLVDYMRLGVARLRSVVDINGPARGEAEHIHHDTDGLRLGALVRMAEAQDHPVINRDYPVISAGAAPLAS